MQEELLSSTVVQYITIRIRRTFHFFVVYTTIIFYSGLSYTNLELANEIKICR